MQNQSGDTTTLDDAREIFALSDEQILEIDPQSQDAEVGATEPNAASGVGGVAQSASAATSADSSAPAKSVGPFSAAEDVRALAELYPGGLSQAKTAAERARTLDEIDAAYFGAAGNSPEQASAARAQLAAMMLREDPAAFREMVFEGLRALENSSRVGATLGSPGNDGARTSAGGASPAPTVSASARSPQESPAASHDSHLKAYAAFEKAANEDLERSVGSAIERTLEQALPVLARDGKTSVVGRPDQVGAPLQARLSAAVRQDVEAALKGDRQLGEQIAQILAARRFDNETRAQVVRLIGERAQQLVPGAAKRVLKDWTQATLAAHHARSKQSQSVADRADLAPARSDATIPPLRSGNVGRTSGRNDSSGARGNRIDYRKLSDEQILDL